jgi:hypothetical protein
MDWLDGHTLLNIALILAALGLGWTILRAVLKFTVRLFGIGCLVLTALAVLAWLVGWIG